MKTRKGTTSIANLVKIKWSIGLITALIPVTVAAYPCYDELYESPLQYEDGMNEEGVWCGQEGTNCTVVRYTCKKDIQFDPDPPSEQTLCRPAAGREGPIETGEKCVYN